MNRKGNILTENFVFIVLNLFFFLALFVFVVKTTSNNSSLEETYSKKIALMADSMKPNTEAVLDLRKISERAESNKYPFKDVLDFSKGGNIVGVKLSKTTGFYFRHFSNNIKFEFDEKNKLLRITS